jgi:hypothetical protein
MYNIFLIVVAINIAMWLIPLFELTPSSLPAQFSPDDLTKLFSLSYFQKNFLYVGIGAVSGLAMLLLRQNTFALYALVIFTVMLLIPLTSTFILAIPNMINSVMTLYPAYNPFSATEGVLASTNPFSMLFLVFGGFGAFWFILDEIKGRFTA